jgi:geranylgeranyl pyrophosphate synthase
LTPIRPELTATLLGYARRVEAVLDRALPPADAEPLALHAAMRYGVLGGGKRIRPMLAYGAAEATSGTPEVADAAAAAVEIIHAYSLIHDDLPAMDDDDLRRGQPTCHVKFGEATAILAGDALQALAFEVLAGDPRVAAAPARGLRMARALAAACGSAGMAGGQAFDLDAVGQRLDRASLERMHAHKTGALIRASVLLGAQAGGCEDPALLAALDRYGRAVGLAFQIRDDILDVEGETAVIGKTRGADAARDKPTYPAIVGLDGSRRLCESLRTEALAALRAPGLKAGALEDLAHYAVDRAN